MGIYGFNQFIKNKFEFRKLDLKNDINGLVIDGNNVCNNLFRTSECDWKLGGEFYEFHCLVTKFFDDLLQNDLKIIVVLNGMRKSAKVDDARCVRSRHNTQLKMLQEDCVEPDKKLLFTPTLILPTFVSVLKDKGIDMHVSVGEASELVAAISNSSPSYPVLAADSDYFMFEIEHGYIPQDTIKGTSCSLYHTRDFCKQFQLRDPMMRLLIPTIHGSGIVNVDKGKKIFIDFEETLSKIKKYRNCEEYFTDDSSLQRKYEDIKEQYCKFLSPQELIRQNSSDIEQESLKACIDTNVDMCLHMLRITKKGVNVLSNSVEEISKESAWQCSLYIRKFLYGFLGFSKVVEFTRREGSTELSENFIESRNVTPPISKSTMSQITDKDVKEDIVFAVLKCHKMPESSQKAFKSLENKWKLPIASVYYWYKTSNIVSDNLVCALLLCFMDADSIGLTHQPQISWTNIHAFAQWQAVYSDSIALNYFAGSPFETPSPATLFSGRKAALYASHDLDHIISKDLENFFKIVTGKPFVDHHISVPPNSIPTTSNRFSGLLEIKD